MAFGLMNEWKLGKIAIARGEQVEVVAVEPTAELQMMGGEFVGAEEVTGKPGRDPFPQFLGGAVRPRRSTRAAPSSRRARRRSAQGRRGGWSARGSRSDATGRTCRGRRRPAW